MKETFLTVVGVILAMVILASPPTVLLMPCHRHTVNTDFDVVFVDAPFGRVYSETHADGSIIGSAPIYTNPGEAYTFKYLEGNQLKTVIIPVGDAIVMINQNRTDVEKVEVYYDNVFGFKVNAKRSSTTYRIYLNTTMEECE